VKKTVFMDWIDGEMTADPKLAGDVDELLDWGICTNQRSHRCRLLTIERQ
jgi:hypothetical protein